MAAAKERVSIVRVARLPANQLHPDEKYVQLDKNKSKQNHPHLDKTSPDITEQHELPRKTKTDLFTPAAPQISDSRNDITTQQNIHFDSLRPSISIQRQPGQTDIWIKRPSEEHEKRSNLFWKATGQWNNSFCSLFDDFTMCCYACSCWCCFRHKISSMMGEHWCLWFISCMSLMELRTKFRQQYKIRGSIAEDCVLSTCCPLCVAVQLGQEGRHYGHQIFT